MSQSNSVNPPGGAFTPSTSPVSPDTSNGSVQELPAEPEFPNLNEPAMPGIGPEGLPTPSLPAESEFPDLNEPAMPGIGVEGLPTPSLPSMPQIIRPQPSQPSCPPGGCVPVCPAGYTLRMVQNNQSFTDLLIANNVSYNAMRAANPELPTTRISPGTRYCAPPSGSRRMCAFGSRSYVMGQGETLYTLTRTLGVQAARLLELNPSLAPGDFLPGRVICIP